MRGRLYLPQECLTDAGINTQRPEAVLADGNLAAACAPVILRAREHYDQADHIMSELPKSSLKAPYMMSVGYRSIFDNLTKRGFAPPRAPVHVSRVKLAGAFLKHLFS